MADSENKYVLIVGASGFIGRFLVDKSLQNGYPTVAGIRESSSDEHLAGKSVDIVRFSYNNKSLLTKEIGQLKAAFGIPRYIIYNAGVTKAVNPDEFSKVNFEYLKTFTDSLVKADCIPSKFLYISSLSVMGSGDEKNYTPHRISDIPQPNSQYGKSKLEAERHIENLDNFPYIILRSTGVYGPHEKDYLLMIKTINNKINLRIGLKPQRLSFIYVEDLADAIFLALESPKTNKTYMVSDGRTYTDDEFAEIVKELLGKPHTLNLRIPLPVVKMLAICSGLSARIIKRPLTLNQDKYYTLRQRNWTCDIEPIKRDLNFSPQYDLREGLKETIEWYNEEGCR